MCRFKCARFFWSALAVMLLVEGCAKAEFLLSGLTLPPGSTVTNKVTGNYSRGKQPALPIPMGLPNMQSMDSMEYVTVNFENSGGWLAVASHFDSKLAAMGYTDSFKGISAMPGMSQASQWTSGMKSYSKDNSKYYVVVMDMGGMLAAAGQSVPGGQMPGGGSIPGLGGFTMTVMRSR